MAIQKMTVTLEHLATTKSVMEMEVGGEAGGVAEGEVVVLEEEAVDEEEVITDHSGLTVALKLTHGPMKQLKMQKKETWLEAGETWKTGVKISGLEVSQNPKCSHLQPKTPRKLKIPTA